MSTTLPAPGGHFLTRVIASAQGAAPSVAPHLPSLFEPVAARVDALTAFGGGEAADTKREREGGITDSHTSPDAYPHAAYGAYTARAAAAHPHASRAEVDAASGSSMVRPLRPGVVVETSASSDGCFVGAFPVRGAEPEHLPSANLLMAMRRAASTPASNGAAIATMMAGSALAAASVRRDAAWSTAAIDSATPRRAAQRLDDPRDVDGDDRDDPGGRGPSRALPHAALIARRLPSAGPFLDSRAPNSGHDAHAARRPAPPDVHISIGRVEIRAQTPPPPGSSTPPARANTPTRLERYLARGEPRR